MDTTALVSKISSTKKYQRISTDVIEAAVAEASRRYTNPAEIDRKSRNILHQLWGAYYYNPPNFQKALEHLKLAKQSGSDTKAAIEPLLELHSSVRERKPILEEFYSQIFSITGMPTSIVDHACGLNPLTIPWMNLPDTTTYTAFDIDATGTEFLSKALSILEIPNKVQISQKSITESSETIADVAFFFKCITCLDHLQKGIGIEALERQACRYAIVSFPIKSIKGYEKGMKDFYSNQFEAYLHTKSWTYDKIIFTTELVYVVKK